MTALPSVVPLTSAPIELDLSRSHPVKFRRSWIVAQQDDELQVLCDGSVFRVHDLGIVDAQAANIILPLDALFDVRLKVARRLWLAPHRPIPGPYAVALPKSLCVRLVMGLRALGGRLDGASYRAIAAALFGAHRLPDRGWKTHDLRDRTIRLCKFGVHLMEGGYRQLLLHPYRQRLY